MKEFEELVEIMRRLRGPDGCPWDREQTHESLTGSALEETYELVEAVETGDARHMCEELGDLLLQIVFHAQLAAEAGEFTLEEVVQGIVDKLVHRHPHVFGNVQVADSDEVVDNWERLKHAEHAAREKPRESVLDGIPPALPALQRAEKMQRRAAKVGFDWADAVGARAKLTEENEELDAAIRGGNQAEIFHEAGDVLLSVVNLCRLLGLDAEQTLREGNRRFEQRFRHMEQAARAAGRSLTGMTLPEMDVLWQEAKACGADRRDACPTEDED
jgi:MazG family protein